MSGYRARLRPKYTDAQLAELYKTPHNHTRWRDHIIRVDATIAVARWMHPSGGRVADLSCGDAAIATALAQDPGCRLIFGDFAPGYQFTGPLEQTLNEIPHVDTYICSETLEHLDDPDAVLGQIREKADRLVLSTPIGEIGDSNPEHYWGWDTDAVEQMLQIAGWRPTVLNRLEIRDYMYDYQIWGCE